MKKLVKLLLAVGCLFCAVGAVACGGETADISSSDADVSAPNVDSSEVTSDNSSSEKKEEPVKLTYKVDGKEYSFANVEGSKKVELPENPAKPGYDFDGWFTDENEWQKPFTEDSLLDSTVSVELSIYAKFNIINYDIKFEGIEGAVNNNVSTYTVEDKIELSAPTMSNRHFKGWYSDGELITEIAKGSIGEITITAKWTIDLTGTIFKAGTDYDLTNSIPVDGVTISLTGNGIQKSILSGSLGEYSFLDLPIGEYVITFTKENYIVVRITITVDIHIREDIYIDIEQSSTVSGTILSADSDLDMSNNAKIEGAQVTLTKKSGTNTLVLTDTTDENGAYGFENLTAGIYLLSIEKEGYLSAEQYVMVEERANIVQNMALEVIEEPGEDAVLTGNASGMVYDAAVYGNVGVEGLTLEVRAGINNITAGAILGTYTTAENGAYAISDFPAGNYTILIKDNRELAEGEERYDSAYFNVKVLAGMTITNQNGSVFSKNHEIGDGLTIVLEWGSSPSDLDSHLTGPTEGGGRFHVYYSNKEYGSSNLDRDDTTSYGPETITVDTSVEGVYRYSIHDYSNRYSSGSTGIQNSGATVKVYSGGKLIHTFYAPQEAGTLWTVFEYDSTTNLITPINTMTNESYPDSVA